MGCDIHGFLEVKINGHWVTKKEIPDNRNYDMFGVLAGVRNYVNAIPISEPRGVPADASEMVKFEVEQWEGDGHSHSWLSSEDFKNYDWEQTSIDGRTSEIDVKTGEELSKASYASVWEHPEELEKRGIKLENKKRVMKDLISKDWESFIQEMQWEDEDNKSIEGVRIVFWFDN